MSLNTQQHSPEQLSTITPQSPQFTQSIADSFHTSGTSPTSNNTTHLPSSQITFAVRTTVLLTVFQQHLLKVALGYAGKTIQHNGRLCEVTEVHDSIRQLLPLIEQDLSESVPRLFWVPRRSVNRKEFRTERIKRQYRSGIRKAFTYPCFMGEVRPKRESVPLESVSRELPTKTINFLRSLGRPETRLLMTLSKETQMMSVLTRLANLKRFLHDLMRAKARELVENLTIEVLRRSKMGDQKISAVYDVLVGGVELEHAARSRGLDLRLLKRTVRRVRAEVRPQMETQLKVWAAGREEVAEAQQETEELMVAESILVSLPSMEVERARVAAMR